MLKRQDAEIRKGQDRILRFTVENAAGAVSAVWYCASGRNTVIGSIDLMLTSGGGGISLQDSGDNCIVSVNITSSQSENVLPAGPRHHELWLTDGVGKVFPVAEGTLLVLESLKN